MPRLRIRTALLGVVLVTLAVPATAADRPVKVFILAGQSNMEGHGFITADPKRNEGKGSLEHVTRQPATADKFKHLLGTDGKWAVRDDVWIHYLDRKGKLTAGFGVKEDRIGPELGFGFVIGDAFEEPVLLIKLAWGGKSLAKDFRPPSAGGAVGPFYKEIIDRTKAVLKDLKKEFPEIGNRGCELAGFGWHQGWNDRVNQAFVEEYEKNMAHFIRDVRKDLGVKEMPFVIAETGQGGPDEKHPRALALMKAQAAVAEYPEFRGNVAFVGTRSFWRAEEQSPTRQGYHWNSNAETYYLIGEAMGKAMKELCAKPAARDPLQAWKHSGTLTLLTTPDGANLPPTAVVTDFPVLVRLHRDWFDFTQARSDGADVRFTTAEGVRLAHQVEEWDAKAGAASVWVRVPSIKGNSRLPLRMYWGKADAADASDGKAVFDESNGYLSVWHMGETVRDDVGTLTTKDLATTRALGVIGAARHFDGKARVECGDKITTYPTGDSPHTTEVWFRPEVTNTTLIGWGNDKPQGKVVMQFRGPPHIRMDCWFSGANVESTGLINLNEWVHVAHVCQRGDSRMYVNGVLAGASTRKDSPLKITSPAGLWIGNWRNQHPFKGDLDEVRVSKVARSADWMRLQHENQKPIQTLVGPLVSAGTEFAVKSESPTVNEGGRVRVTAQSGGAEKLYWSVVKGDREEVLAVDRFTFEFAPGRVTGDTPLTLRFKAVLPNEVKTRDIDLTIKEVIPDPEFTLQIPAEWDGRKELVLVPQITNLAALNAAGGEATDVRMLWSAGPLAVIKETVPGKLRLLRAQNSGPLTVTATLSNGGRAVTRSATIIVKEPATDAWVYRVPQRDEKPEEGQFYARDDRNEGTLHYNGTLDKPANEVFLKVYCDDKPFATETARPGKDSNYALTAKLKPGLVKYRVEFGTRSGGQETVLDKVGGLLCGDAFLIEGQSNAEALDLPWETPRETSDWVRTYGGPLGRDIDGEGWVRQRTQKAGGKRPNLWCPAVWKFKPPEHETFVGWWGMQLGKRLVESQKVPVCLVNGALGGTRIDEHQRNPANPADLSTIYGRWLWRLREAKLTHGIRAVIWHQGENDQPADGPSGEYGWKNYHRYFVEMAAGWKRDMPNVRHYYAFQIWPNSCAMGGKEGAGDRLREQQRTLADLFSNLSVMSTLGIRPPGSCHFPLEGYNEFARLLQPLIERDVYGKKPAQSITPPNLRQVRFANAERDALTLEFDQTVVWKNTLISQFYLDGAKDQVASGSVEGPTLTLKLKAPSAAKSITYLKETTWSQDALLVGENGIAALTFCEVPVLPAPKEQNAAEEARRARLQIINESSQTVDLFWLKSAGERVPSGAVEPGQKTVLTTTLGHRFVIVGRDDKTERSVTSEVLVQALRFDPPDADGIPAFYTQRASAGGFPIVASAGVNPYALKEAAYLIDLMLAHRPDIRKAMIKSGSRLCILAWNEFTTDQPEWKWLAKGPVPGFPGIAPRDYRDARARGMGGSMTDPFCSCGEENLLGYRGDPYAAENILIHEFAHNIHLRGMSNVGPAFDGRVKAAYDAARDAGLWKGKYASVNHHEYFAEGVQSWFDNNRENDHDHNHVNTRAELLEYDPRLAALCREVFGDTKLTYTRPTTRLTGHLKGYDPARAPEFVWPERLKEARKQIRAAAEARDRKANELPGAQPRSKK